MSENRYGRLFTEADVEKMLRVAHDRAWATAVQDSDESYTGEIAKEDYAPLSVSDMADHVVATLGEELTFPTDEPLFLLRAQDACAPATIADYEMHACRIVSQDDIIFSPSTPFSDSVGDALSIFEAWQAQNPDRVKIPD